MSYRSDAAAASALIRMLTAQLADLITSTFSKLFTTQINNAGAGEITRAFEFFLATGNLGTKNGLGLMQDQGFTVLAERINQLRFVSHFRAIHRGAFFMTTRTTDVRKLVSAVGGGERERHKFDYSDPKRGVSSVRCTRLVSSEAVDSILSIVLPLDGAPCGLLNHVTASCNIVTQTSPADKLDQVLERLGVITHSRMTIVGERHEEETGMRGACNGQMARCVTAGSNHWYCRSQLLPSCRGRQILWLCATSQSATRRATASLIEAGSDKRRSLSRRDRTHSLFGQSQGIDHTVSGSLHLHGSRPSYSASAQSGGTQNRVHR